MLAEHFPTFAWMRHQNSVATTQNLYNKSQLILCHPKWFNFHCIALKLWSYWHEGIFSQYSLDSPIFSRVIASLNILLKFSYIKKENIWFNSMVFFTLDVRCFSELSIVSLKYLKKRQPKQTSNQIPLYDFCPFHWYSFLFHDQMRGWE